MAKKGNASSEGLSRKEKKELDVEIQFYAGLVKRDPEFVEALQLLGDDYTRRGHYELGLEIDLRLARLQPKDPMVHYNLACSYALTQQIDEAAGALNTAIDLGYRDFKWLSRDPDLANLRNSSHYKSIHEKIRQIQANLA